MHNGSSVEKMSSQEFKNDPESTHTEMLPGSVGVNDDHPLDRQQWLNPMFFGTYMALSLGMMANLGAFTLAAPNLGFITVDLKGSPGSITWAAIVYVLMQGVGNTLIGRVTDIFGRRWFFIGAALLGVIGDIVGARAKSVATLVVGYTMIGGAIAAQGSFAFVIAELVPIKYRFLACGGLYLMGTPFYILGAKVGTTITFNSSLGWRWIFYVALILNATSTVLWFIFYHPPTFIMLQGRKSKYQMVLSFDYAGFVLFTGGVTLLLLGLNWGGSLYAWNSAHVLCALIIGFALLIGCILYEYFFTPKEPYIPLSLFRNLEYDAVAITMAVVAMAFYGFSIIWPSMVSVLYPGSPNVLGWKFCLASGMITIGDLVGLLVGGFVRRLRYFLVGCMVIGTAFTGAVAIATQHNEGLTIAMLAIGCFFLGVVESIAIVLSGIAIDDQNDIGTAVGIAGSIRSLGGALASTVYSTILANRLKRTIPALVPAAVVQAGLPTDQIPALLQFLQGILPADKVSGLTPNILAVGMDAYQTANAEAYRTCFLASIAFCLLGLIASCFCPDLNPETEHLVAKQLHKKADEHRLEQITLEKIPES